MTQGLQKRFHRLQNMYHIHGLLPVLSFFISKFYPLRWIFRQFSLGWLIRVKIHGNYMYLNAFDPGISTMLLTEGTREPGHVAQVRGNIISGMTGIDLGANIGYYALMEAQLIGPNGRIYAIEPAPSNLELLEKSIRANGYEDRFLVSQYLIGDRDGLGKLQTSNLSNRHSVSVDGHGDFIEVPMITLDTFMKKNRLIPENINFLRMDIEGYEVMAFQNMQKLMSAKTPLRVFIEFHPGWYGRWGWTFERFLDQLESYGLRVRSISFKSKDGITTFTDPSREQILATQIHPMTSNGGCHAFLERVGS